MTNAVEIDFVAINTVEKKAEIETFVRERIGDTAEEFCIRVADNDAFSRVVSTVGNNRTVDCPVGIFGIFVELSIAVYWIDTRIFRREKDTNWLSLYNAVHVSDPAFDDLTLNIRYQVLVSRPVDRSTPSKVTD